MGPPDAILGLTEAYNKVSGEMDSAWWSDIVRRRASGELEGQRDQDKSSVKRRS